MSGGQVGQEGPGLAKDPPETSVGTAAAGQVGVEQRIRLEAQQSDLFSSFTPWLHFFLSQIMVCIRVTRRKQNLMKCLRNLCTLLRSRTLKWTVVKICDMLHQVRRRNYLTVQKLVGQKALLIYLTFILLVEINHAPSVGGCCKAFWGKSVLPNLLFTHTLSCLS